MRIYGLKNCDTCRKALKSLMQDGREAELVDIRVDGISTEQLGRFHAVFGDRLLNTRSTTWRGLSEAERQRPALDLIATHPAVMKRPVIEAGDQITLGWDVKARAQWLGE